MAVRSYDFMQSEPEVHELLRRFVAQWRGAVGPKPADRRALIVCEALDQIADDLDLGLLPANEEPCVEALRRLIDVLIELPSTDVWGSHSERDPWPEGEPYCRVHGSVRGANAIDYRGCDRLAWIGDKLLNTRFGTKNLWPEPGVWSSWFESNRRRH